MRDCARIIDGQYCGRPQATTRIISAIISVRNTVPYDFECQVDLCTEHAQEFDIETELRQ